MIRAIFIFVVAALGAVLVAWLVENPGWVTVDWFGFRLETSMIIMALVLVLAFVVLNLVFRFLRLVTGGPGAWRAHSGRQRAQQGMGALTEGLAAAAAGDASKAHRHAERAERFVTDGPLARVLALEAAELEGRKDDVAALAPTLLDHPETELLGRRALFDLARASGDQTRAADEAEAAFENHPAAGWAAEALLGDALHAKEWDRAKSILVRAVRHDAFPGDRPDKLKSTAMLAEALEWDRRDEPQKALALARKACEADESLVAAAVLVAEQALRTGKSKRAREIIQALWEKYPHPRLGRVFAALEPDETLEDRLARLQELISVNPDHVESRLLFAEHAIAARNVAGAREALKDLLTVGTSARAFALMASLDKTEHGAAAAPEDWIDKALAAPRDGVWLCKMCGHREQDWGPVCSHCFSVATAQWATHVESPSGAVVETSETTTTTPDTDNQATGLPQRNVSRVAISARDGVGGGPVSTLDASTRQPDDPGTDEKDGSKGGAAW